MDNIGTRLKKFRTHSKLSLKDLAEATGLSISAISQFEKGLTQPSVNSLYRIAAALDKEVTSFFETQDNNKEVILRSNKRKRLGVPSSKVTFEVLVPNLEGNIEMLLAELEPGGETAEEPASHEGEEECLIVIGGDIEVTIGEKKYILHDKDSIYFNCSLPHKYKNISDKKVITICCVYPPKF
ncbi:MAG: cupin domain-containing protein [Bacillota bacterium]